MNMTVRCLPRFRSPADQATRDLQSDQLEAFALIWNDYLDGITQQAIIGNPWQQTNSSNTPYYYNPLTTKIPTDARATGIQWSAMPGRIAYYNENDWGSQLSKTQIYQLADFGWQPGPNATASKTFPNITKDPCSEEKTDKPFGPYGPRGWQDEYCEWSVLRDASGKIIRIDFTCENPEYWYTLWRISPDVVLDLYRSTLNNPAIQAEDLWLKDPSGKAIIDPSTNSPAYNPLNIWNSGPIRTLKSGGAMHLTSTPNTLQTEIAGLAGSATIQRPGQITEPAKLLCCAQFGQPFRNSDPHIGLVANLVVRKNKKITISDPPGLYIQTPDFSQYKLPSNAPANAKPSDYWKVVRGASSLNDMYGNQLPGNFILHAVFEVPPEQNFTVSDITISDSPIMYAAQIAATFFMQINATAIDIPGPLQIQPCVGTPTNPMPQPLQMFFKDTWEGYIAAAAPINPVGVPMVLASNTVILPPTVAPGQSNIPMILACTGVTLGPKGELPSVTFDGEEGSIKVQVLKFQDKINYAVPGNTYPSDNQILSLVLGIEPSAAVGLRGVRITNFGQKPGQAAPAFLRVAK